MIKLISPLLMMVSLAAGAQAPSLDAPLPRLDIASKGELLLQDDEFDYAPWSSEPVSGKVHVLQYFAGTMSASETFKPFTDRLQEVFELGSYDVTTIINLDAATWGTGGFVVSQVKSNKRKFPHSTLVLDKEGKGVSIWELGEKGAGLLILDEKGVVKYFTREPMDNQEIDASVKLVRFYIES